MFKKLFDRTFLFDEDQGGGGGSENDQAADQDKDKQEEQQGQQKGKQDKAVKTVEELQAELEEREARIKALNAESAERRKKLEAFEKADEEKKRAAMSELEKAKKDAADAQAELEKLKASHAGIQLERAFEKTARELKFVFASEKAQDTGFALLDKAVVGEDGQGIKDALAQLQKDHPYLFKAAEADDIDATDKGRGKPGELTKERETELKGRFRLKQ
jgi:chromosome segregation ATPase